MKYVKIASLLLILVIAMSTAYAAEKPASCSSIKYEPRPPITGTSSKVEATSVTEYSPLTLKKGWYTFDHIGYKDTAYAGERHVGVLDGNALFFGYDREPMTDMMLLPHPDGENQIINTVQVPIRADWHTLNGNGILFGCQFNGLAKSPTDYNTNNGAGSNVTISGYSVVATLDKIQVRKFSGVTYETIGKTFSVLYEEPKKCPGQNFTIEITGGNAKVFLDKKKIYEFALGTPARGTGLVVTYEEHNCNSLSSVAMKNHTVNNVEYLKKAG